MRSSAIIGLSLLGLLALPIGCSLYGTYVGAHNACCLGHKSLQR